MLDHSNRGDKKWRQWQWIDRSTETVAAVASLPTPILPTLPNPDVRLNMTLLTLLTGALSPANIQDFNKTLLDLQDDASEFLRPQTLAKSFTMLLAGVRLLCGGPFLSETHGFTRFCAGECVRTLQDISSHWNRKAALDKNKTESFRLQNSLRQSPARQTLAALYFLHTCERFFFKSVLESGPASVQQNLRRVTAFVYLSMVLSRAATRAGVFLAATMDQMDSAAQPDGSLTLLFDKHKTLGSYGTLACKLAPWCVEIIADYLKDVRPLFVM